MNKSIYTLLFIISIVYFTNAQERCGVSFSAYSKKTSVRCKYCNERSELIVPYRIKFNRTLICDTYNNALQKNASLSSEEGTCKLNSIILYISARYFFGWVSSNNFPREKCLSNNNPSDNHVAYEDSVEDVGLKEYSFEDYELKAMIDSMEEAISYIDYASFQQGRSVSAEYAIGVIQNSCN